MKQNSKRNKLWKLSKRYENEIAKPEDANLTDASFALVHLSLILFGVRLLLYPIEDRIPKDKKLNEKKRNEKQKSKDKKAKEKISE